MLPASASFSLQTIPQNICVVDASTKLDDLEATAEGPALLSKGRTLSASPTFEDEDEESEYQGAPCQDSLRRIEAKEGEAMIESNNFRHLGFRNEVTEMILETLALLPETQRNIFVWRHYRGHQVKQIATVLGSNCLEVEATLEAINSILCQRTRSLIGKESPPEPEVDSGVMPQEASGPIDQGIGARHAVARIS